MGLKSRQQLIYKNFLIQKMFLDLLLKYRKKYGTLMV